MLRRENFLTDLRFLVSRIVPAWYVGWTGRGNMGDEFLYDAVRQLFKESLYLYAPRRKGLLKRRTDERTVDFVFLGGGTLINQSHWARLVMAKLERNPDARLVVFGTGVADREAWHRFGGNVDTALWTELLERAAYIGVRGPLSKAYLTEWGVRNEVQVIGDPAILFASDPDKKNLSGRRIGLNLSTTKGWHWGRSDETVIDFGVQLIRALLDGGWEITLFPVISNDVRVLEHIMARAGSPRLAVHRGYLNLRRTLDRMASMDVFVGLRLHSVVMSSCVSVPSVMLEYRPKCEDFMRSIDREKWRMRTDELDIGTLMDMIGELRENRSEHAARIAVRITALRRELISAAQIVTDNLIFPPANQVMSR